MKDEPIIGSIYGTAVVEGEQAEVIVVAKSRYIYFAEKYLGDDNIPPAPNEIQVRPSPYAEYINYNDKFEKVTIEKFKELLTQKKLEPRGCLHQAICAKITKIMYEKHPDLFR